jgi:membrane-bound lytic murein transglycosylase
MTEHNDQHNGPIEGEPNNLALGEHNSVALHNPSDQPPDIHNLEKIRDILFGSQVRTHEQRFSRLEERLEQECKTLRSDLNRRLDTLESYIQTEVGLLSAQIQETRRLQAEAVERLEQNQHLATKSLEQKLSQLEEKTTASERHLRQQALEQSNQLSADVIGRYNELLTILEREVSILHTVDKTDRGNLASFFGELSARLQSE